MNVHELTSLPSRGAWIEISASVALVPAPPVAPLAGSVDRNNDLTEIQKQQALVAPLAGSVDRNTSTRCSAAPMAVAPLAGSVDRNLTAITNATANLRRSPRGERG